MTLEPRRLVAVAISPLSYLGGTAPSAIEVVQNLRFTRADGSPICGEARARMSADRATVSLSMRESGISRKAVEIWKLTDRPAPGRGEERPASRNGFVPVALQRPQDLEEKGSFDLVFDLTQAGTMSGSIDVSDLRRLGFDVPSACQAIVEGIAWAPAAPARPVGQSLEAPQYPLARAARRSAAGEDRPRRRQRVTRQSKLHTGSFATRAELTARIWALRRQQMFPNLAAIARECGTTPDVVRVVVEKQEGLEGYMQTGSLMG